MAKLCKDVLVVACFREPPYAKPGIWLEYLVDAWGRLAFACMMQNQKRTTPAGQWLDALPEKLSARLQIFCIHD